MAEAGRARTKRREEFIQEVEQKQETKKPAHEVLVERIKKHYPLIGKMNSPILRELGEVIHSIVIPPKKLADVKKELVDLLVETTGAVEPSNRKELQEIIKRF